MQKIRSQMRAIMSQGWSFIFVFQLLTRARAGRCWWRTWGQPSMPCVSRQEESKSSRPRPRSARTVVALRSRSFSINSPTMVSISRLPQWGTWAGKGGRDKKVKVICLQTTYIQGMLRFPDGHSLGQNQVLRQWARIDHYKIVTDDIQSCLLKQRYCKALVMDCCWWDTNR